MAYVKIKDRNLQMLDVSFMAKGIRVNKLVREDRVEAFRQNMLMKFDLLFKKEPHTIGIKYKDLNA